MTPTEAKLTALAGGAESPAAETLQATCARPGCSVLFSRPTGPGRPAAFCGETCRRAAQRERRTFRRRLTHHEDQAQQLRLLVAAYERSVRGEEDAADDVDDEFLSPEIARAAEDAVVEMRGMARFLTAEGGQHAGELLRFYEAVAPLIDHYRDRRTTP